MTAIGTEVRDRAEPGSARGRGRWGPLVDLLAVGLLLELAVAARPGYLRSQSLWLDESWVACSVRAPLRQLSLLTSSTPIGWTALLRLVPPIGPPEPLRMLPLAFGALSVVPAYLLGRRLGRIPALAAGLAAALAPSALSNRDLKQYSADVFVTLLLFWLAARVEAEWSPRRLVTLGAVCVPAALVSHVTVFASAALVLVIGLRWTAERRWDRLRWLAGLALALLVVEGTIYGALLSAGDNAALRHWWAASFVPLDQGLGPSAVFVADRGAAALGRVGFGHWALAAALVCAGLVALWRASFRATALAVPVLTVGLVAAGALHRYPFLDERTSMFFTVLLTVSAGLGVGALAALSLRRPVTIPLGLTIVAVAALLLVPASQQAAHRGIPYNTVRQQIDYVLAHRQPGDVVVSARGATFAMGYYWPDRPSFVPNRVGDAVLFQVEYPDRPDVLVIHRHDEVDQILHLAAARGRRIWLVAAEESDDDPGYAEAAARVGRSRRHDRPGLFEVLPSGS